MALALGVGSESDGHDRTDTTGQRKTAEAADTGPRSADYIVAIVNSEPVTNYEVRSRIARVEQQLAQQGGNAPTPPRELIAREVLERIILEKAQLQLAREDRAEQALVA